VNDNGIVTENMQCQIGSQMKSFRLHVHHKLVITDEPIPIQNEGETLLKMVAVGICGSDLHSYSTAGKDAAQIFPGLILGHEFVAADSVGKLFAVDPAIPCDKCKYCLGGNPNLCPTVRFAGHDRQDGALREWISWPTRCLVPLPASFTPDDGVMLEPLGIALHALNLSHLQIGMDVGIFGCGPIGLLLIQLARLAGAKNIVATDVLPHRVEAAKKLGATHPILVSSNQLNQPLVFESKPVEVDAAFDCSGSPGAVSHAFHCARPGGKVLLLGIPETDRTEFTASIARRKGLSIFMVRRMKHTYMTAINLLVQSQLDVRSIVTHHFPFVDTPVAFETAVQRQGLKVIIEF
jgi:L-iditol 2-dehydrogenase